jgi:hypothetical protein
MATHRKTGTLNKVGKTVKKAAKAVGKTTEDYVVKPVTKAMGLNKKTRGKTKKTSPKRCTTSSASKGR